ncbi:lactate utilization protein C [Halorubrum gandharaense]
MSTARTSAFREELDALDVSWTIASPAECADAVDAAAGEPAVGVPLDRADGAHLPERVATTPTTADLRAAHTGVTAGALGIAEYGSVAIEADGAATEPVSLFVERHVVVLDESDLVDGWAEAFDWLAPRLREDSADVVWATGPSATADMGGLVRGAHGPKEVHVVLIRDAAEDEEDSTDE